MLPFSSILAQILLKNLFLCYFITGCSINVGADALISPKPVPDKINGPFRELALHN
jgi:hypothetical protein